MLTGEGADEMFGGYDIFKEAKVRLFCAADPASRRASAAVQAALSVSAAPPGASRRRTSQAFFTRRPDGSADPLLLPPAAMGARPRRVKASLLR